jgi:hypothetical protein
MTKQDSPTTAVPEELLEKLYIYFQRLHVKYDNPFEKTDTAALKDEWYPIVTKAIESYGNSRELETLRRVSNANIGVVYYELPGERHNTSVDVRIDELQSQKEATNE